MEKLLDIKHEPYFYYALRPLNGRVLSNQDIIKIVNLANKLSENHKFSGEKFTLDPFEMAIAKNKKENTDTLIKKEMKQGFTYPEACINLIKKGELIFIGSYDIEEIGEYSKEIPAEKFYLGFSHIKVFKSKKDILKALEIMCNISLQFKYIEFLVDDRSGLLIHPIIIRNGLAKFQKGLSINLKKLKNLKNLKGKEKFKYTTLKKVRETKNTPMDISFFHYPVKGYTIQIEKPSQQSKQQIESDISEDTLIDQAQINRAIAEEVLPDDISDEYLKSDSSIKTYEQPLDNLFSEF